MNLRILSAASALALAATVSPAGAQSVNTTINLCVGPNGKVRLVGPSEACRNPEDRVSFDLPRGERGPAGPAGPQGPAGPAGPQGPQGQAGQAGLKGDTGAAGAQGPQGPAGTQGEMGPAGAAGAQGPAGPAGAQGEMGPAGPKGDAGVAGPAGPAGPKGDAGVAGPAGAQGPAGAAGAQGPAGPAGPKGDAGVAGSAGPAGPKGDAGVAGPAGPQGPAGAAGAIGPRGLEGPQGPQGLQGPQGPAGPAGSAGAGLRAQHSWNTQFDFTAVLEWVAIPGSAFTFMSEGGPLLINVDMSLYSPDIQTASCRPMIDGRWAGDFGGFPYSSRWTEGLNYADHWTLWSKTRVYPGVPAGGHTFNMECTKDGFSNLTVGHAIVPLSVSVLEMH